MKRVKKADGGTVVSGKETTPGTTQASPGMRGIPRGLQRALPERANPRATQARLEALQRFQQRFNIPRSAMPTVDNPNSIPSGNAIPPIGTPGAGSGNVGSGEVSPRIMPPASPPGSPSNPIGLKRGGMVSKAASKGKHSSVTPVSGRAGGKTKPCKIC